MATLSLFPGRSERRCDGLMAADNAITIVSYSPFSDLSFLLEAAQYLVPLIAFAALGLIACRPFRKSRGKRSAAWNAAYKSQLHPFSKSEHKFLQVLDRALGKRCRIFGKVRVADVLDASASRRTSQWLSSFSRIKSKHFDYFVCSANSLELKLAVELDDSSHRWKKRADRDAFLEEACSMAGLPLVRFPDQRSYAAHDIQGRLYAHL